MTTCGGQRSTPTTSSASTPSRSFALDASVEELCRDLPELQRYGKVRLSTVGRLRSLGFAVIPTFDRPHFDVVLPDLTDATLDRLELGLIDRSPIRAVRNSLLVMARWDLWLDYHRRDADGLTHGNVRNARPEVKLEPGRCVVVGNEEADPAVAEVVRVEDNGVVVVRLLPGSVEDNRELLDTLPSPR